MNPIRILLADDDVVTRTFIMRMLSPRGYEIVAVTDGEELLKRMDENFALVILDLRMPKRSGLFCLKEIRRNYPNSLVIVISSAGIDEAVTSMKEGAFWFEQKPLDRNRFLELLERAVEQREQILQNVERQLADVALVGEDQFIGLTNVLRTLAELGAQQLQKHNYLTLQGEPGVEHLSFARHLHNCTRGSEHPFLYLNFASIPRELIETTLFGYKEHALKKSLKDFLGKVELAGNGTLYLEDLSEVPLEISEKLVTLLRNKTFVPVGATDERLVNCQFVLGTTRSPKKQEKQGYLSRALRTEIERHVVELPALRDRKIDIPLIIQEYLGRVKSRDSRPLLRFSDTALEKLLNFNWPGNLTQLKSCIEHAAHTCTDDVIESEDLDLLTSGDGTLIDYARAGSTLQEIETMYIQAALAVTDGKRADVARMLNVSPKTIYNKLTAEGSK